MNRRRQKSLHCGKKKKAWSKKKNKEMTDDDKEYLKETDKGSYYNQEAWIEELEYNKGFCHDNEYSSDESEDKDSRESK